MASFVDSQRVGKRSWCSGNCFHDLIGHSLPARTGLSGLTLHHKEAFARRHANWTNNPASPVHTSLLLITWVLNKLHLPGLALRAASCMCAVQTNLSFSSPYWTALMAKAADQTLLLIKHPGLNQMIKLATDVIKSTMCCFLWGGEWIIRFGCEGEGSCCLI